MKNFNAIDLFSGSGGLSLGLEKAGFKVLSAVEIDPIAAKTYKINHPQTNVIQADIRNVSGKFLKHSMGIAGTLDLLAGCPPCQGFSRIKTKNRKSFNDSRNNLVLEFVRLAKDLKPKLVLLENVPGLAKDRRFVKLIQELTNMGYQCDWSVLNAANFGVPQRRKRLIMMASRLGKIGIPKGENSYKTVRDYIGELSVPNRTNDTLHKMYLKNTPRIKKLIARIPKNGGSRESLGKKYQLTCHKKLQGFRDIYGRMSWDEVAPTLTGGCFNPSKGRFLHPSQNRPITLREAALLQTFPRNYKFPTESGLTTIAKMIGDAIPPNFGMAQGKHLIKHLNLVASQ